MKKQIGLLFVLVFSFFSCQHEEKMQLPKAGKTVVKELFNHSPVYFFFRTNGNDTLVKVNRNSTISTTNWIFNIDKRLPLKILIPEVIKLQLKKATSPHQDLEAQNYYSYADSIGKNLAFLPFTTIKYKLEKPKTGICVLFTKNKKIYVNGVLVQANELQKQLNNTNNTAQEVSYCFDKNMSFDEYMKCKIFVRSVELKFVTSDEYVY